MANDVALKAESLRKSYGGVVAVESFSLEVGFGKVVGFLGPNGAGKTTVIRMLSTILAPDAGAFWIAGVPHTRPEEVRRRLGVLPESAGYPYGQTGEEWLSFHGRLFGRTAADASQTARRLLEEVGLADRGRAGRAAYSRGMRQRLGIARALVNDPQVVFLDEPTLGLDPGGQQQVLELVARMARQHGVTVVLSTHLLAEVEAVCDQVLIINRGRVVAEGTVAEVAARAAAPRQAVVQVPPDWHGRTLALLAGQQIDVCSDDGQRGRLVFTVPSETPPEAISTQTLRCLLAADVPVVSFSVEGGRLSEAFLTVTGASDG